MKSLNFLAQNVLRFDKYMCSSLSWSLMFIERRLNSRNVSIQNQCWFPTCDKDRISTRNVQFILSTRKLGKSFCPGVDWWNGKAAFRQTLSRIKPQTEHLQLRPVGSNFIYIIKPKIFLEVSSAGNPVSFDYSKFVPVRRPVWNHIGVSFTVS